MAPRDFPRGHHNVLYLIKKNYNLKELPVNLRNIKIINRLSLRVFHGLLNQMQH